MRLVAWGPADLLARLDDVIAVYGEAMRYSPALLSSRKGYVASHVHRPGFLAVATLGDGDELLGFGYGYTSMAGQWWHDQVRTAMRRESRAFWLRDCFELVELHVRPRAQGHRIGTRQLTALLAGTPHTTVLLSTPEADEATSPAWRLYRGFGFVDILRHFYFPGDERAFGILGRQLPLEPDPRQR